MRMLKRLWWWIVGKEGTLVSEAWTPVRFNNEVRKCDFCWEEIPRFRPGNRVGDRGTKAWYCKSRNVWECMDCRSEATRADLARDVPKTQVYLFPPPDQDYFEGPK